jgi:hypothetical protein
MEKVQDIDVAQELFAAALVKVMAERGIEEVRLAYEDINRFGAVVEHQQLELYKDEATGTLVVRLEKFGGKP